LRTLKLFPVVSVFYFSFRDVWTREIKPLCLAAVLFLSRTSREWDNQTVSPCWKIC